MSSSYESNYRKIARADELGDKPRVYRAAGATLVMRRNGSDVSAIDGSCLADTSSASEDVRVKRIMECVAAGVGSSSSEWSELHARAGLPVRLEDGDVWVCVEGCRT
ncbi:MAG TPA: hypothetical protein VFM36_03775 [Thermoanaerobaculia bacterium]|nr:hypothetical protein [Thermoanaerobaculia bacterium]